MSKVEEAAVYEVRNLNTGRIYIGSSSNPASRLAQHESRLKNGTHRIKAMQEDYNEHEFEFNILQRCTYKERGKLETLYLQRYKESGQWDKTYNVYCRAGRAGPAAAKEMRQRYAAGETSYTDLGESYGITSEAVALIITGKNYPEVGGPIKRSRHRYNSVDDAMIEDMRQRYAAGGIIQKELAEEFGLNRSYISKILTGKVFADAPGPIKGSCEPV